ncbi:MAG: glycosyltransferase [Deltaproteobacteria bacterium]|nr:glycosyltransferase [Deltaproteobacteria bacterium]MBW2050659.1 glycosyltransferase [Deltaproteobacteria bacterium]MBW2139577.1 glycosyltransferase [Deltaproteobacteria bacterium]MBW2322933.1 glycosyltransferase [Deltaproteobacteria bacterium]
MSPAASVIIPAFNRAGLLPRAVDSVLDQTFEDFELIVVDDGSTDQTLEVLAAYQDRLVLLTQPHKGVSAARNHGLSASRGGLVAFLDSDDYWLPEKLAVQVDFFRRNPLALICQTEEIWCRRGRRVTPGKRHAKPSGDIFERSLELCLVSPSAVMIKRELFDRVGVFDETMPACEDYDLWLRIASRYPVYMIDQPLVVKTGGHEDQLSQITPALDKYRIQALLKLLKSGTLKPAQERAVRTELARKATIYGHGCLKRGREQEGQEYLELARRAERGTDKDKVQFVI